MRVALPWAALGFGLLLGAGCGAGKDPTKRPGVNFGGSTSGGTTTGGDEATGAGRGGSGATGAVHSGGTETGGRDDGGHAGAPALGGAGDAGAFPGGATSGGAETAGASGAPIGGNGGATGGSGATEAGGDGGAGNGIPIGQPCSGNDECEPQAGGLCYSGPGTSNGTCRVRCEVTDAGVQGSCSAGDVCVLAAGARSAGCLRPCEPFVTPGECDSGDWCVPAPSADYTGGTSFAGLCNTEGVSEAGDGEPCDAEGCRAGLSCYLPAFDTLGSSHCEPICVPGATTGEPGACPAGQECRLVAADMGVCLQLCDPFGPESCPADEWCAAHHEWDGEQGVVEGQCVKPGSVLEGDSCSDQPCAAGLVCASPVSSYSVERELCRPLCDLTGDSCTTGTCAAATPNLDAGFCVPDCQPFESGTSAGCQSGEWCAPTLVRGAFACADEGTLAIGETCTSSSDCVSGGYCECRFGSDSFCLTEARCEAACDPSVSDGEPGACAGGEVCVPEALVGEVMPFGTCRLACDFASSPSCSGGETCVPAEVSGAGADACVDVATPDSPPACSSLVFDPLEPCGALDVCFPDPTYGLLECTPVCRSSAGTIGETNHPDCPNPTDLCAQVDSSTAYGACE